MTLGDYLDEETDVLTHMRVLIEGAETVFESDGQQLGLMAMNSRAGKAVSAFNVIGFVLVDLRDCILRLQDAHMRAVVEHIEEGKLARR